jgi:hypothetical protein
MRYLAPAVLALTLAACASTPQPERAPVVVAPVQRPSATSALVGLTASELVTRFGQPSFQVREGPGIKLQWSANGCVLDTYLYSSGSGRGAETVTHIDTRRPSGGTISQPECVGLLLR